MMSSNLPLLFIDGYPTTFDNMTVENLETFITFMVRCSFGHDTATEIKIPPWWPADLPFTNPFQKPRTQCSKWLPWRNTLVEMVKTCYRYHEQEPMLEFSIQLAGLTKQKLRVMNNFNGTSSFYDKVSGLLLVTVRNELLTYDQSIRRKLQLKNSKSNRDNSIILQPKEDIFMCHWCLEDFFSLKELREHQDSCSKYLAVEVTDPFSKVTMPVIDIEDDDDVVLVQDSSKPNIQYPDSAQVDFLTHFHLRQSDVNCHTVIQSETLNTGTATIPEQRRTHGSLLKGPTFEFSSPFGQVLLKQTKKELSNDCINERLARIERFTKKLPNQVTRPKRSNHSYHTLYSNKFESPRKSVQTFSSKHRSVKREVVSCTRKYNFHITRKKSLSHLHSLNIKSQLIYKVRCRELYVKLTRLSSVDIDNVKIKLANHLAVQKIILELEQPNLPIEFDIIEISDTETEVSYSPPPISPVDCKDPFGSEVSRASTPLLEDSDEDVTLVLADDVEPENENPFKLVSKLNPNEVAFSIITVPKRRLFGTIQLSEDGVTVE